MNGTDAFRRWANELMGGSDMSGNYYPGGVITSTCASPYYSQQQQYIERYQKMDKLFVVYMINGENRKDPKVDQKFVIAKNDDEAKLFAGFDTSGIDKDFLTIYASVICEAKVKPRPTEVKNVTD